jgi:hypothetical protein
MRLPGWLRAVPRGIRKWLIKRAVRKAAIKAGIPEAIVNHWMQGFFGKIGSVIMLLSGALMILTTIHTGTLDPEEITKGWEMIKEAWLALFATGAGIGLYGVRRKQERDNPGQ